MTMTWYREPKSLAWRSSSHQGPWEEQEGGIRQAITGSESCSPLQDVWAGTQRPRRQLRWLLLVVPSLLAVMGKQGRL